MEDSANLQKDSIYISGNSKFESNKINAESLAIDGNLGSVKNSSNLENSELVEISDNLSTKGIKPNSESNIVFNSTINTNNVLDANSIIAPANTSIRDVVLTPKLCNGDEAGKCYSIKEIKEIVEESENRSNIKTQPVKDYSYYGCYKKRMNFHANMDQQPKENCVIKHLMKTM